MKVSFEGIGETAATFYSAGVSPGQPVKIGTNNTVVPCGEDDSFVGVALSAGESHACVQIGGCVTLPYSGDAPELGFAGLSADGAGGVQADEDGRQYAVISAVGGTITIILEGEISNELQV
jgi:hypothetical protein